MGDPGERSDVRTDEELLRAVARWVPFASLGVAAAVAVTLIQSRFLDDTTWPWDPEQPEPVRFLGFLAEPTSVGDPALEVRPSAWHVAYLVALIVVMVVVSLARDRLPRVLAAAGVAALVATAATGWVQTRPPSEARVDAMVARLTRPTDHQHCERRGPTQYCAYAPWTGLIDEWASRVDSVRVLLPPDGARRPLLVTQRVPSTIGNSDCGPQRYTAGLPGEVTARLDVATLWPADGEVHPDLGNGGFWCSDRSVNGLFTAVQVGAWAVGLPPAPHHGEQRCDASGQARAVVALWLGASATPDGAVLLRDLAAAGRASDGVLRFEGWDNPPMWGAEFGDGDVSLALGLLARPAGDVGAALGRDWQRWSDPATTATELARGLSIELPTVGAGSPVGTGSAPACH